VLETFFVVDCIPVAVSCDFALTLVGNTGCFDFAMPFGFTVSVLFALAALILLAVLATLNVLAVLALLAVVDVLTLLKSSKPDRSKLRALDFLTTIGASVVGVFCFTGMGFADDVCEAAEAGRDVLGTTGCFLIGPGYTLIPLSNA